MIFRAFIFWFLLFIPGYAVVRRCDRRAEKTGLLGTLGLSYLSTLAMLSPVAVASYLLGLPLVVLTAAIVILTLLGLCDLLRNGCAFGRMLAATVGVELLFLAGDLFLSARVGSLMGADAIVHLGRIRFLLDHGFSNADIYVAGDYFFALYHTNLLHALAAAGAQITGSDHLAMWFAALPWAKLLVYAGAYYLTWSVTGSRWAGWAAALFTLGAQGPVTFAIYPNKLAPFWLLATAIGLCVQACQTPHRRYVFGLACCALVVGQIHALYGVFAFVVLAPVLTAAAAIVHIRRKRGAGLLCAGALVLLLALPFAWFSRAPRTGDESSSASAVDYDANRFVELDNGQVMTDPTGGFGSLRGLRFYWLAGGVACALLTRRRRYALTLLGPLAVVAAILYFPPITTMAVKTLGAKWILLRLEIVFWLAFPALGPGVAALFCQRWRPPQRVQSVVCILALLLAIPISQHQYPYDWYSYLYNASLPTDRRIGTLSKLRDERRFLQDALPPGETLAVEPHLGMTLAAVYDVFLIAPQRGSIGVPNCELRRSQARALLWGPKEDKRAALINEYGVRYIFARDLPYWAAGRVVHLGETRFGNLWRLTTTDLDVAAPPNLEPPPD